VATNESILDKVRASNDGAKDDLGKTVLDHPQSAQRGFEQKTGKETIQLSELSSSCSPPSPKDPIVFIFYDAGTTKALEPVMGSLDKKNVKYCIIAFATAKMLVEKHPHHLDANKMLGVKTVVDRLSWPREKPLDKDDVDRLQSAIDCNLLIIGTSSILEAQLAKKLQIKGVRVAAYYDAFQPPPPNDLNRTFIESVDEMIVPCESVREGFHKLQPSLKVLVLGQPTLDVWRLFSEQFDVENMRRKLKLFAKQAVLLYAGGYGEGYEESFRLFLEATKSIKHYKIIIALHPKVDGQTEKRIMREMGIDDILLLDKDVTTLEACLISNIVVTQCSTVGVQAHFIGIPTLYLDTKKDQYSNIVLEKKRALQVDNVKDFLQALAEAAKEQKLVPLQQLYSEMGVPFKATDKILQYLVESLESIQKLNTRKQQQENPKAGPPLVFSAGLTAAPLHLYTTPAAGQSPKISLHSG